MGLPEFLAKLDFRNFPELQKANRKPFSLDLGNPRRSRLNKEYTAYFNNFLEDTLVAHNALAEWRTKFPEVNSKLLTTVSQANETMRGKLKIELPEVGYWFHPEIEYPHWYGEERRLWETGSRT